MKKILSKMYAVRNVFTGSKAKALFAAAFVFGASAQSMALDIVSHDATTGEVTFAPMELITPIIGAIIATVTGAAAIVLITIGVKKMVRFLRGV